MTETETPGKALSMTPSPAAIAAAQQICAWHELSQRFAATCEAQVMEQLRTIRREIPDDRDFDEFVTARTPLAPEQARLSVQAWSVARKSRPLRELVSRSSEEVRLVGDLVRVFGEDGTVDLDAADQALVEVAALPLRQQRKRMRALIEAGQAAGEGRHPADLERIRTLEAERDAARGTVVVDLDGHPGGQARTLISDLRSAESDLADLASRAEALFSLEGLHNKEREGAVRLADMLSESVDRIARLALGESL